MEEVVLKAKKRQVIGKQVNALRRAGKMPAIIYGRHIGSIPLELDMKETSRLLQSLSSSTLVLLQVDGEEHYALVREKQRNPLGGTLRHIDFQAVSLTEKVRAEVSIHLVGQAPAIENYGGILVVNLEELEVEALPRDLPDYITVDVSNLKEIGDSVFIRDLTLPGEVVVHAEPDDLVVVVTPPISEAALEEVTVTPAAAEVEGAEPEVIEKGKREEEEEEEE